MNIGTVNDNIMKRSVYRRFTMAGTVRVPGGNSAAVLTGSGTDCLTVNKTGEAADKAAASMTVYDAVNTLLARGFTAENISLTVLLPETCEEQLLKDISDGAGEVCSAKKLALGTVEAIVTAHVLKPFLTVSVTGRMKAKCSLHGGAKAGQDIVMAGFAGNRGTHLLTGQFAEELSAHYSTSFISGAFMPTEAADAQPAADIAVNCGCSGMRTVAANGVFGALWEMASEAGLGLRANLKSILLKQETVEVCDYFDVSPYMLLTAGTVLIAADHGQMLLDMLAGAGIPAAVIGHFTDDNDRVIVNDGETRYLEASMQDAYDMAIAHGSENKKEEMGE